MSTHESERPTGSPGVEPADLSELTATDALLNRLGSRAPADDDLSDPAVLVLSDLLTEVDEVRAPDAGAARLIEVLAGRPLYIAGADPADSQARAGAVDTEPVPAQRVIDLTSRGPSETEVIPAAAGAAPADLDRADDPITVAARAGDPVPAARRPDAPASLADAARRREQARGRISISAAAVVALVALGGGVSAAVTGDPMAPVSNTVNGISRVVDQLPGVSTAAGHKKMTEQVRGEITAAERAARVQDGPAATAHLAAARRGLGAVPASDQEHLVRMIENVQTRLGTGGPLTSPTTQPELGITPTSEPPASEPPPSTPDTTAPVDPPASEPEPEPEPEPTADPEPSAVETTPQPAAAETAAEAPSAP